MTFIGSVFISSCCCAQTAFAQAFNMVGTPNPQRATATSYIDSGQEVNTDDPNYVGPVTFGDHSPLDTKTTPYNWSWSPNPAQPQPAPAIISASHKYKLANATVYAKVTGGARATVSVSLTPYGNLTADTGVANPSKVKVSDGFQYELISANSGRIRQNGSDVYCSVSVSATAFARGDLRGRSSLLGYVGPLDGTGQSALQGARVRTEIVTLNY